MENSKYLSNVIFLGVDVIYKGDVVKSQMGRIDIGSISLSKDGREYNQDVGNSHWMYLDIGNISVIEMALDTDEEILRDTFDSNFELREEDLDNLDTAEIYIGGEYEVEPKSITLFYKNGESGYIKEIELSLEK